MSWGSFPPVQIDKQAALSYGQVGPVARRLAHSSSWAGQSRMPGVESSASWPCPESSGHKHSCSPLATPLGAPKRNIAGEESRTKERSSRQVGQCSMKTQSRDRITSLRASAQQRHPERSSGSLLRVTDFKGSPSAVHTVFLGST